MTFSTPIGIRGLAGALGLALLGACASPPSVEPEVERPNIVLIVIDTLRDDRLGSGGNPRATSPHLDRFARRAVVYPDAVSPSSWTTAAMGALFTSRYPTTLGIFGVKSALADELETLAEALQGGGYVTSAVVSNGFCGRKWNFDQGFDHFDDSHVKGFRRANASDVTDSALVSLERLETGSPFFLWLHYVDPHTSYKRHEAWDFGRDRPYDGPVEADVDFPDIYRIRDRLNDDDVQELLDLYDSEIAYTDHHIGRFLRRLDARGLSEGTLVVATSDHGEEFLDHGNVGHDRSVYDELLSVPLFVKPPASASLPRLGLRRGVPSLLDLFPTFLDAAGLDIPDGPLGRVVEWGADDRAGRELPVFGETARGETVRCVRLGGRKAILWPRTKRRSTYDLVRDPGEQVDLHRPNSGETDSLHTLLDEWSDRLDATAGTPLEITLAAEQTERLKALGYVGD